MTDDGPLVLQSAMRHGVSPADALHAWAYAVDAFVLDDGLVMYIGPPVQRSSSRPVSSTGTASSPSSTPCPPAPAS